METPPSSIRLPPPVVAALDLVASRERRTRSNLIAVYVERGLRADGVAIADPAVDDKSGASVPRGK